MQAKEHLNVSVTRKEYKYILVILSTLRKVLRVHFINYEKWMADLWICNLIILDKELVTRKEIV